MVDPALPENNPSLDEQHSIQSVESSKPLKSHMWLWFIFAIIVIVVLVVVWVAFFSNSSTSDIESIEADNVEISDGSDLMIDCSLLESDEKTICEQLSSSCGDLNNINTEENPQCSRYVEGIVLNLAKETKNAGYCGKISSNLEKKEDCYMTISRYTGNPAVCDKLSDPERISDCVSHLPIVLSDIKLEDIPEKFKVDADPEEYELYSETELVHVTEHPSPGSTTSRDEYHFSALNPSECEKVRNAVSVSQNNNVYANCIKKLSRIMGDFNICNNIEIEYEFKDCLRRYASESEDVSACFEMPRPEDLTEEFLEDDEYSDFTNCVSNVVAKEPSVESCELLSRTLYNNHFLADACYANFAGKSGDETWCAEVEHVTLRENCQSWLEVLNAENCEDIDDMTTEESCYEKKARETGDVTYCNLITKDDEEPGESAPNKFDCIMSVLWDIQDVGVCHEVEDHQMKKRCYGTVNAFLKSSADCDKIPEEFEITKAWCYTDAVSRFGGIEDCDKIDEDLMDGNRNIKERCLT